MLNSAEHELFPTIANSFLLKKLSMKCSVSINMKMPTIVGIFIFICRENFMLSAVQHEKKFLHLILTDIYFIMLYAYILNRLIFTS